MDIKTEWEVDIKDEFEVVRNTIEIEDNDVENKSDSIDVEINRSTATNHECELCGRTFSKSYYLKQHMIKHSEERPFQCDICHLTFKGRYYLDIHRNKHLKKTRYEHALMEHLRKCCIPSDVKLASIF